MLGQFGAPSGVQVGATFVNRMKASRSGVHRPPVAGIAGRPATGAESIVLNGGYVDDLDTGDVVVYTGAGGNDPVTKAQIDDQQFARSNLALARSCDLGIPVRVIRGSQGDGFLSPRSGYRYDGLYRVDHYWQEPGRDGYLICRYRLVRTDPSSAPWGQLPAEYRARADALLRQELRAKPKLEDPPARPSSGPRAARPDPLPLATPDNPAEPSGWHGTISAFLSASRDVWLEALRAHQEAVTNDAAGESQVEAWKDTFAVLQEQLHALVRERAETASWGIIFEYVLPRERGRRPDVAILAPETALILEFKGFGQALQAHVDQTAAYAHDIQHYHAQSHHLRVVPILVLSKSHAEVEESGNVTITPASALGELIAADVPSSDELAPDLDRWLAADYAPLPSLVQAARLIFEHEPLPNIRRAHSAGIPDALNTLLAIAAQAQQRGERHLALVTGVPGSGKTLLGLQLVYSSFMGDEAGGRQGILLSGNGPFVAVLQHALRSRVFVQDVHGFLKEYGGGLRRLPEEHVWVYDEAQRAWDANRVFEKRGHSVSEPEDFLRLGGRMPGWSMIVGLIGEGQEIHVGEEAGLGQWSDAIAAVDGDWTLHAASRVSSTFTAANNVELDDRLDLTTSLRSHLAEDVQTWVRLVLIGYPDGARPFAQKAQNQGFDLYVTRELETAEAYVRDRYADAEDKRFGLIASSKAKNLE
ncbi:MAG: hypothetical protein DLM70_14565, partial [Chloroflexi bacterium]